MHQPTLLTVLDVQRITNLGRTKVYELIRTGELPVIRIGRALRVHEHSLEAWLHAHEDPPSGVPPSAHHESAGR